MASSRRARRLRWLAPVAVFATAAWARFSTKDVLA